MYACTDTKQASNCHSIWLRDNYDKRRNVSYENGRLPDVESRQFSPAAAFSLLSFWLQGNLKLRQCAWSSPKDSLICLLFHALVSSFSITCSNWTSNFSEVYKIIIWSSRFQVPESKVSNLPLFNLVQLFKYKGGTLQQLSVKPYRKIEVCAGSIDVHMDHYCSTPILSL